MICYKDRTLCSSDCTVTDCFRYFSDDDMKKAQQWWGGGNPPISFCDYSKI